MLKRTASTGPSCPFSTCSSLCGRCSCSAGPSSTIAAKRLPSLVHELCDGARSKDSGFSAPFSPPIGNIAVLAVRHVSGHAGARVQSSTHMGEPLLGYHPVAIATVHLFPCPDSRKTLAALQST